MEKLKAIYPGSFDPFTVGHSDIAYRASNIFDLTIGVAVNSQKPGFMPIDTRINLIKESIDPCFPAKVVRVYGLLSEFCLKNKIGIVIKGLRNNTDFEQETNMFHINSDMDLETVFLVSERNHTHISSSAVRELCKYNTKLIKEYVPKVVYEFLQSYDSTT